MTNPLDNSDLANLILADWHEEYGDIDYADAIRKGVLEPKINSWNWSDEVCFGGVGGYGGHLGGEVVQGGITPILSVLVGDPSFFVGADNAGGGDKSVC